MFAFRIVAISLCLASLQFLAECSLSDKDRRAIYQDDLADASRNNYYIDGKYKRAMGKFLFGDMHSRVDVLEEVLNSAWIKGEDSKRLLEALGSLKEHLSKNPEKECDLNVYDQILSIVRMSDKYFEGRSTRARVVRMSVFRMHDIFTNWCVRNLKSELQDYYKFYAEELYMLTSFREFLKGESLDLIKGRTYPDNSPSMMNKLNLVSDGDRAWYEFMMNAALKVADKDRDRAVEIRRMPRKERMAAEFEFIVNNSCVSLSQKRRFVALVDEVSSLTGKFVFELVDGESLEHEFEELEKHAAMYKICMRLKDFNTESLMAAVELHTRENPV